MSEINEILSEYLGLEALFDAGILEKKQVAISREKIYNIAKEFTNE